MEETSTSKVVIQRWETLRTDKRVSLFAHKKEFGGIEPVVGKGVSFVVKSGDKGDSAAKVREEDSVPEAVLSDEGREFGTVKVTEPIQILGDSGLTSFKSWMQEKGFGFIGRKQGGDEWANPLLTCPPLQQTDLVVYV